MKALVLLLVALAAGVALAAFFVPMNAATVNGTTISRNSLNSDLHAIAGSPSFQCYLEASSVVQSGGSVQLPLPVLGAGSSGSGSGSSASTYNTRFVDYWLNTRIGNALVAQVANKRHVTLTSADLAEGRRDLETTISGSIGAAASAGVQTCSATPSQVLGSLPGSFVNELVHAQATQDAVQADASGYGLGSSDLDRYFYAHRAQFDQLCLSVIAVSTQAQAQQIRSAIESGSSFSQEAQSNSLDTSSASRGGALGCFVPATSSIVSMVTSLGVGQISQPISYQGAYLLLQVTARRHSTLSQAQSEVPTAVIAAGRGRAQRELTAAVRAAHIDVDPRYGNWSPSGLVPPNVPPSGTALSVGVNEPGTAVSGSGSGGSGSPRSGQGSPG